MPSYLYNIPFEHLVLYFILYVLYSINMFILYASLIARRIMRHLVKLGAIFTCIANASGFFMCATKASRRVEVSRREVVERILGSTATLTGVLVAQPLGSLAILKVNNDLGRDSFRRIRDARNLLDEVELPLRTRKFEEVQDLLEQEASTKLEKALMDLVQSNVLPTDDKVAIGTIRRYGLAADALIMQGGLSGAVRDENGGEARRYLSLMKDSLNDIITIATNNDLNKL